MGFASTDCDLKRTIALLNSTFADEALSFLAPTLGFKPGYLLQIPQASQANNEAIYTLVNNLIFISQADWDSQETSWDFKRHALL